MFREAKLLSTGSSQKTESARFRAALSRWYRKNGRDLPWRRTRDPYAILVSEFMLQQTQVAAVIPYYQRWLRRFPDFATLARASESDVLRAWQGLGYYRRARNLHAAAKIVIKNHGGRFPRALEQIKALPGVGPYTANAVATFAFGQAVPVVEANIARVVARLFNSRAPIDTAIGRDALWKNAASLLPKSGAPHHNSALMDLGALVCTSRFPKCEICPVRPFCCAEDPAILPVKKKRPVTIRMTEHHTFSISRGRILLEKSLTRWRGLWILPRLPGPSKNQLPLYVSEFPFTHHCITLSIFAGSSRRPNRDSNHRWFPLSTLTSIPMPSPHRRAVRQLLGRHHFTTSDLINPGRGAHELSGNRNPMTFRVLAAAWAETGKFPEAIGIARRGMELASEQGQLSIADLLQADLVLYQQGIPLRENNSTNVQP